MDEIEEINQKLDALFDVVMHDRVKHTKSFDILAKWIDDLWERYLMVDDRQYSEWEISQLKNRVTYLHNELNEVKKNLGMDGSVPRVKRRSSYD